MPSYTQMVLGVGYTFKARAYNLGFEHKPTDSHYGNTERIVPSIIWGSGINLRLRGVTLFGEFKLPVPSQGYGFAGPAAPLTFGIRF